jgi:glycerophosphoryl diester phosphodiesterase
MLAFYMGTGLMSAFRTKWFWLLSLCFVVFSSSSAMCGPLPGIDEVKLIAHRGYHVEVPENSLASLQAAMDLGIAGGEVDLRTSKDGHLVLMHDSTLERTTTGKGRVDQYLLSDLKKLHLEHKKNGVSKERIPTLEEALRLIKQAPDFRLSLDLMDADPVQVAEIVLDQGVADRVVFAISNPNKVDQVRAIQGIDPTLKVSLDILMWWRVQGLPAFTVRSLGVQALFASEWFFPDEGFYEAREAGAEVNVFIYGDHDLRDRLERAVKLGAQVVYSDRPDLMKQELISLRNEQSLKQNRALTYTKP